LLSSGGTLELGGLAAIITVLTLGVQTQPNDGSGRQMLDAAFPAAITMGTLGLAAIIAGSVCAYESKVHRRRASAIFVGAAGFGARF
jgi:hypothetical protein